MSPRKNIMVLRGAALAASILLRGRARAAAWTAHEILRLGPTLLRNSALNGPVARQFQTAANEVWLTIDDGPDALQTPRLLDLLAAHQAQASFFVIGRHVDQNRAFCRRMVLEGHSLENHTYSHPSAIFWALPCCAIRSEIERCNHAIRVAAGTNPAWFRTPVGLTNACVHPAAARSWLRVAGWSSDGRDGIPGREPRKVADRILRGVKPGAILLLHEGPGRNSAEVLRLVLEGLAERGFRCVIPKGKDVG